MSKNQDALDLLYERAVEDSIEIANAKEIIQELVDKATPKAIVMTNSGFVCPTCGVDIKVKLLYAHYCNECGQRLE